MSASPSRSRQKTVALLKLRELILSGVYAPGERVAELALVDALGVSRTPARLALTLLEHEGLLRMLPGGGFVVRDFSISEFHDAIELRGVLEGMAARLAAERAPKTANLDKLKGIVDALDEVVRRLANDPIRFQDYVELNGRFHSLLLELAASPMLARSLEHVETLPFASPNAFMFLQAEQPHLLIVAQDQHRVLVDAIACGEGARAEAIAREHARLAHRNLALALERRDLLARVPGAALMRGVRSD